MITLEEARKLVEEKEDYVNIRRFKRSLKVIQRRYPDGAPDHIIAQALARSEDEVQEMYDGLVEKLKAVVKKEGFEDG